MPTDSVDREHKLFFRSIRGSVARNVVSTCSLVLLVACGMSTSPDEAEDSPQVERVAEALSTSPDALCVGVNNSGHDYWFCPGLRTWQDARNKCQAIGYDLASIESATENQFILSRVLTSSWLAGTDVTAEGVWRWAPSNLQFWQGKSNGTPVGSAYRNWRSGQPDDLLNQDCLQLQGALGQGKWTDENCSLPAPFVCEGDMCPNDPNKTEPGQCGCGSLDTDSDADGTANCNDQCPNDATKITPGVCGCGSADTDSDNDGTLNCNDQCPNDSKRTVPGDCGCANAPRPTGTACDDGMCAANSTCDGAGSCGTPAQCGVPDSSCSFQRRGTQVYWFCDNQRSFSDARTRCNNVGMDLSIVSSSGENDFVRSTAHGNSFIGGSDQSVEGEWTWLRTGAKFWTGGQSGQSVGGAYTNWDLLQPSNLLSSNDCLVLNTLLLPGKWQAASCTSSQRYVCELTDLCPSDPNKIDPGVCGCGIADTDSDSDGTKDCVDGCPQDPQKIAIGQCGCGISDTDGDADGVANCRDACPDAPDTDTDHDGLADCVDRCPADPTRAEPGNCGCVGHPNPAPAGMDCFDGLCQANNQCDGAGSCGSVTQCVPSGTNCTPQFRDGHLYLFCSDALSWAAAQTACRAQPDMDLVRINDPEENAFVQTHLAGDSWVGASDQAAPGLWSWNIAGPRKGRDFWSGASNGQQIGFANWQLGQPDGGDCVSLDPATGRWFDTTCATAKPFVCEVHKSTTLASPSVLINQLNGIDDARQRAVAAYGVFAAQRAVCNVNNGIVESEMEHWIQDKLQSKLSATELPLAMARLTTMCNNLVPSETRQAFLGSLAGGDPLDLNVFAAGTSVDECDVATALTDQPARLRANFCAAGVAADSRAISVGSGLALQVIAPDGGPIQERHKNTASPVVIGLDEVDGFSQVGDVVNDRTAHRTPDGAPGDGYNMYGVRTNIPCTTGSCDPNQGHLCSSEAPGWPPVVTTIPGCTDPLIGACDVSTDYCIAYPVVQFKDDIKLIGHNFWDTCSAKLLMTEFGSTNQHTLPLKGRIGTGGEPSNNDTLACTPSPDGQQLAAANINSSALATFTSIGESLPRNKFYTLQMFNRNGTMSTQHDVQERELAGANLSQLGARALHVCWNCDSSIPDTNCPRVCTSPTDTHCAIAHCGAIAQTCENDGCEGSHVSECDLGSTQRNGTCAPGLWPTAPRDLSNPLCAHNPGEEPRCAETPFWFGSNPDPIKGLPIIFLVEAAPDYRVTLNLQQVTAKQETPWDCFFCNDDDLNATFTTLRHDGAGMLDSQIVSYQHNFDEGDVHNPNLIASVQRIHRSENVRWALLYSEGDNFLGESIVLQIVLSVAGGLIGGQFGPVGGAIGTAVGGILGMIPNAYSDWPAGVDYMGAETWQADLPRLNQAYGDSRAADLLLQGNPRKPIAAISDTGELKWTNSCDHLMHPFDRSYLGTITPTYDITEDNGRGDGVSMDCLRYSDQVRQCGPGFVGVPACTADHCFAGRCTNAVVGSNGCHPADMFCGHGAGTTRLQGFFERRDIAADGDAGEARYIWDYLYTVETCDPRVSPGNVTVCQALP